VASLGPLGQPVAPGPLDPAAQSTVVAQPGHQHAAQQPPLLCQSRAQHAHVVDLPLPALTRKLGAGRPVTVRPHFCFLRVLSNGVRFYIFRGNGFGFGKYGLENGTGIYRCMKTNQYGWKFNGNGRKPGYLYSPITQQVYHENMFSHKFIVLT
jgi:hypothetical protein